MDTKKSKLCRRALLARARRRRQTLFKKADELRNECGAEIYIVIFKHGRYFTYTSTQNPMWPPSKDEIVSFRWLDHVRYINYLQELAYPLPVTVTPPSQEMAANARRGDAGPLEI